MAERFLRWRQPCCLALGLFLLFPRAAQGAAVQWVADGDGLWSDAANWDSGAVPTFLDDVVIDRPSGTFTITVSAANADVRSLQCAENLVVQGRNLIVRGNSAVTGAFTMTSGANLIAAGAGVEFRADGATNIDGAHLNAQSGATLRLPQLTSYSAGLVAAEIYFRAEGAGSAIDLSSVTSVFPPISGQRLHLWAFGGATLIMDALTEINSGRVSLQAEGATGLVDVSSLTSILNSTASNGQIVVSNGGEVRPGALTQLDKVDLTFNNGGVFPAAALTAFTHGVLSVTRQTVTFSNLDDATGSWMSAGLGGVMHFPVLASYQGEAENYDHYLTANGPGAVLDFPVLTALTPPGDGRWLFLWALDGGLISLPLVDEVPSGKIELLADGASSLVDARSLSSISITTQQNGRIRAANGGEVRPAANLTQLDSVDLELNDGGVFPAPSLTTFTRAVLTVTEQTVDFTNLSLADGSWLTAGAAGVARFPALENYAGEDENYDHYFTASGAGAVLDLPNLTGLTPPTDGRWLLLTALSGGEIQMPEVTLVPSGKIELKADGPGSLIDVPQLSSIITSTAENGSIKALNGGEIRPGTLTSLDSVDLSISNGGIFPAAALTSFTRAVLSVSQQEVVFSSLTNLTGSWLAAGLAGVMRFPVLVTYLGANENYDHWITATGLGAIIDFPVLTNLTPPPDGRWLFVWAQNGGRIDLPALEQVPTGKVGFKVDGASSLLNLPELNTIVTTTTDNGYIQVNNGGEFRPGDLSRLHRVNLSFDGSSTFPVASLSTFTYGALTVSNQIVALPALTDATGSSFFAGAGGMLRLPALSSYTGGNANIDSYFQASGNGAELDFPALTELVPPLDGRGLFIWALNSGAIQLPLIESIDSGKTGIKADGVLSLVAAPQLVDINITTAENGYLRALDGGAVEPGALTHLDRVNVDLVNGGVLPAADIEAFTSGSFSVTGQPVELTALETATGSSFFTGAGGSLSLPGLSTYAGSTDRDTVFRANGTASAIEFGALSVLQMPVTLRRLYVQAWNGGSVQFPMLETLVSPVNASVAADGDNSVVDLSALQNYVDTEVAFSETNNGQILFFYRPNLLISDTNEIGQAQVGEVVVVEWEVTNIGRQQAAATFDDCLAFSPDVDPGGDIALTCEPGPAIVAAGGVYARSASVVVPNVTPGAYYLVVTTDSGNDVGEYRESDNTAVLGPITVGGVGNDCVDNCAPGGDDADGDGLNACAEACLGTSDGDVDSEGDGLPDSFESRYQLDPLVNDANADPDGDRLTNLQEFLRGTSPTDRNDPAPLVYVSATGSDQPGSGGPGSPYASIGYALAQVTGSPAGATVLIGAGTYRENVVLTPAITLQGEPGSDVVIEGSVTGAVAGAVVNVTIRAVDITPPLPSLSRSKQGNTPVLLVINNLSMTVRNVTFEGTPARTETGIQVRGTAVDNAVIADCRFEDLAVGVEIEDRIPQVRHNVFQNLEEAGVALRDLDTG
ncbi:MAG: hypothetical protein HYV26_01850, partial [Candidatus Hydrogenedentes bacterium]|nr:hypothetical protein [Candidatus Hydrogenedentota bacterium]